METIQKYLGEFVGTTIAGIVLRLVIAGLALYTGSATNVGDAIGQALDKDRSIAAAVELINETPVPVIAEAIKAETAE